MATKHTSLHVQPKADETSDTQGKADASPEVSPKLDEETKDESFKIALGFEPLTSLSSVKPHLKTSQNDNVSKRKNIPRSQKNKSGKRWSREEDILLFKQIRTLEAQGVLTLDEILSMDAYKQASKSTGVRILAELFGWKGLMRHLVLRVKSLCNKDFSIREIKRLKKIVKSYKYQNLDYTQISYEFPGQTEQKIKQLCEEICERKKNCTLSEFQSISELE